MGPKRPREAPRVSPFWLQPRSPNHTLSLTCPRPICSAHCPPPWRLSGSALHRGDHSRPVPSASMTPTPVWNPHLKAEPRHQGRRTPCSSTSSRHRFNLVFGPFGRIHSSSLTDITLSLSLVSSPDRDTEPEDTGLACPSSPSASDTAPPLEASLEELSSPESSGPMPKSLASF